MIECISKPDYEVLKYYYSIIILFNETNYFPICACAIYYFLIQFPNVPSRCYFTLARCYLQRATASRFYLQRGSALPTRRYAFAVALSGHHNDQLCDFILQEQVLSVFGSFKGFCLHRKRPGISRA